MKVLVELEVESMSRLREVLSAGAVQVMSQVVVVDSAIREEMPNMYARVSARHNLVTSPRPMVKRGKCRCKTLAYPRA